MGMPDRFNCTTTLSYSSPNWSASLCNSLKFLFAISIDSNFQTIIGARQPIYWSSKNSANSSCRRLNKVEPAESHTTSWNDCGINVDSMWNRKLLEYNSYEALMNNMDKPILDSSCWGPKRRNGFTDYWTHNWRIAGDHVCWSRLGHIKLWDSTSGYWGHWSEVPKAITTILFFKTAISKLRGKVMEVMEVMTKWSNGARK